VAGGERALTTPRAERRSVAPGRVFWRVAFYVGALAIVALFVFPYYWQFITAMKPPRDLYAMPAKWFPSELYLGSFVKVFTLRPFGRYMLNSLIVATSTTVLSIFVGSLAAYALARLPIKGRIYILGGVLSASMFPGTSIIGPLFLVISNVGLVNTFPGLVWPYTSFSLPFTVWVLTNFYSQIPLELEEAAEVDGCSPLQAFYRVIVPLAAPGLATTAILVFISAWNEFLFALTFTRTVDVRTVPVAIAGFTGINDEIPWGEVSAAAVTVTLPLIVLAIIFQRRIVQGLTAGAIKG
jgi:trehalose/maltose transport system permease protein